MHDASGRESESEAGCSPDGNQARHWPYAQTLRLPVGKGGWTSEERDAIGSLAQERTDFCRMTTRSLETNGPVRHTGRQLT